MCIIANKPVPCLLIPTSEKTSVCKRNILPYLNVFMSCLLDCNLFNILKSNLYSMFLQLLGIIFRHRSFYLTKYDKIKLVNMCNLLDCYMEFSSVCQGFSSNRFKDKRRMYELVYLIG